MQNSILIRWKKFVLLAFVLVLLSTAVLIGLARPVVAQGTIYIRKDGSVDPPTAPIQRDGNVYTFTDNIYDEIVVERDNIVVDGAGYTLQGTRAWYSKGIDMTGRSNGTIKNTEIKEFFFGIWLNMSSSNSIYGNNVTANNYYGIYLEHSSSNDIYGNYITKNYFKHIAHVGIQLFASSNDNSISGNNITNNFYGILLWESSNNTIYGNDVTNNDYGIVFTNSSNNIIYQNNFVDNTKQVYSYNSTNVWTPEEEEVPFWMQWWLWAIVAVVIVALAGAVYFLKKRKPPTPTAPTPPT